MKLAKTDVAFEHPARGPHHCSQCRHFNRDSRDSCEIVAGRVLPRDWCTKFASLKGRRDSKVAAHMNNAGRATA